MKKIYLVGAAVFNKLGQDVIHPTEDLIPSRSLVLLLLLLLLAAALLRDEDGWFRSGHHGLHQK